MDFTNLISQIQKNHKIYTTEYQNILTQYSNTISLPLTPFTTSLAYINFLSTTCHFYVSEYASILLTHLSATNDAKLKKELINHVFTLKHKRQITDHTFFTTIIKFCDLTKILNKVIVEIRDTSSIIPLFRYYVENGDDKQMSFGMYMLCYVYEVYGCVDCEEDIIKGFYKDEKISKICTLYLLNEIEFNKNEKSRILSEMGNNTATELVKHIYKQVKKKKELRDVRIKKIECIDLIKKEYDIKFDISECIFQMLDPSKDDLQILMELLVDNLSGNISVVDKIIKMFCVEYKDDDFIVYGLNFLKEICVRNDFGDFVKERTNVFNKNKSAAINLAYRAMIKAIKTKTSDNKDILYVKKKKTKEEKVEM
ncbi:hypothetical protein COBT_002385, partial [Conglomerata obtusa]